MMNKVHAIEKEIPHREELPVEKKACEYSTSKQMKIISIGKKNGKEQGCFMGKLVYLFEGKEEICKNRAETDLTILLWRALYRDRSECSPMGRGRCLYSTAL